MTIINYYFNNNRILYNYFDGIRFWQKVFKSAKISIKKKELIVKDIETNEILMRTSTYLLRYIKEDFFEEFENSEDNYDEPGSDL